ncbi:hypothetical protein ACFQX7_37910 [Luedemannella flava]
MARPPHRPPTLRGKIFHGPSVVAAGLLTQTQLRGKAWRRLLRGVYADAELPVTHELRCHAVAAHLLPEGGAIAGRSAAALLQVGLVGFAEPVEILVPTCARPRMSDVIAHVSAVEASDRCRIQGMPVTTPLRTCWDLAQWLPAEEAVVLLDRFLRSSLVTKAELASLGTARRGGYGSARFARPVAGRRTGGVAAGEPAAGHDRA